MNFNGGLTDDHNSQDWNSFIDTNSLENIEGIVGVRRVFFLSFFMLIEFVLLFSI